MVLAGSEDGTVRLWDTRLADKASKTLVSEYSRHTQYISSVKFNTQVENIFLSGSLDGTVKLWDLRNDEMPVAQLKHKNQEAQGSNHKVFTVDWNGPS